MVRYHLLFRLEINPRYNPRFHLGMVRYHLLFRLEINPRYNPRFHLGMVRYRLLSQFDYTLDRTKPWRYDRKCRVRQR